MARIAPNLPPPPLTNPHAATSPSLIYSFCDKKERKKKSIIVDMRTPYRVMIIYLSDLPGRENGTYTLLNIHQKRGMIPSS